MVKRVLVPASALLLAPGLVDRGDFFPQCSPNPAMVRPASLGAHAEVRLSVSAPPALGMPVILTLVVTPTQAIQGAEVEIGLPTEFAVLDATPGGYVHEPGSGVVWAPVDLLPAGPSQYAVEAMATSAFYKPVVGRVVEPSGAGRSLTSGDALHVKVDSTGAAATRVLPEPIWNSHLTQEAGDGQLQVAISFDRLPRPQELALATVTVTNVTTSELVAFTGELTPPAGWTLIQPDIPTWTQELAPAQDKARSFVLRAGSEYGDWVLQVNLDDPSQDDFHVNYYGASVPSGVGAAGGASTYLQGIVPFRYGVCANGQTNAAVIQGVLLPITPTPPWIHSLLCDCAPQQTVHVRALLTNGVRARTRRCKRER